MLHADGFLQGDVHVASNALILCILREGVRGAFAVKSARLYLTAAYRAVFSGCRRSYRIVRLSPNMGFWKNGPDT